MGDDNWNDDWNGGGSTPVQTSQPSFNQSSGTTTFSKGRGFKPTGYGDSNNNGFGGTNTSSNNPFSGGSSFGADNSNQNGSTNTDYQSRGYGDDDNSGGYQGGRGGGRGRGRGGRGGGFRSDNNDESGGGYRGNRDGGSSYGGGFGGDNNEDEQSGGRGGFRGRGGRGGRGGGGFRNRDNDDNDGGFRGNRNGGGFGDDNNGDESGGFRGRGGRGGGRGGSRPRRDDDGHDDTIGGEENAEKKAPVTYVPPEPSENENDMYDGVSEGINFCSYETIDVQVDGDNCPKPITSFDDAGLRDLVLSNVKKSKYTKPTPVQKHAWPIIMGKRDLMACAQTGSGKTAAFMVPIVNMLLQEAADVNLLEEGCEPHVVIMSPTRELAMQIFDQARKFTNGSVLKQAVIYGGVATAHHASKVKGGCHILVATPGRLWDFVNRRRISFASVRFLVLDEADRMLDMGFRDDIEKIIGHESMVPVGQRQTLMFSATFPDDVQDFAKRFLQNYIFVKVGIVGGACRDVEQEIYELEKFKKRSTLLEVLENRNVMSTREKTLIFVDMKKTADFLAAFLSEKNYPATSIHGDREQNQREEALRDFRSGKMPILVGTNVAARGLDIQGVSHVINFDMPKEIGEYVHRIGRTGRLGNKGHATTFFCVEENSDVAGDLVKILKEAGQKVPDFLQANAGFGYDDSSAGAGFNSVDNMYGSGSNQNNQEEEEAW